MATRVSRCPTNVSTRECRIGDRTEAFHVFISPSRHFLLHPNCCGYIEIEDRGARSVLEVSYRQLFLNKRVCVWFNNKTGHIGPKKDRLSTELNSLNWTSVLRLEFYFDIRQKILSRHFLTAQSKDGTVHSQTLWAKVKEATKKKRSETIREC